ncbi:hypothetical protein I8751_12690 [Nostocaceae cyanobacterium CENA357]|uniref:Uncharacterized protein n=1 Tax=Atlanticothrix silvestris CENA357 TaxID=1725252 RepID=A0A8J7HD38_9CYAN|nr:hypothetical protein [Atlanticothrix silvestris]MBH8553212.1 hypothetical protein [Atlanticothrix silvestris CENA357]
MNKPDDELELDLKPRATETVSIEIPTETLQSLKKIAANRDMSLDALIKFYVGQSLRQDLANLSLFYHFGRTQSLKAFRGFNF